MNQENIEERFLHLNLYGKGLISLSSTARNLDLSLRQVQRLVKRLEDNNWNPKVLLFNKKDVWNRREGLRNSVAILHKTDRKFNFTDGNDYNNEGVPIQVGETKPKPPWRPWASLILLT